MTSVQTVLNFFKEIDSIPRGSYHTDKIADYCVRFAQNRGLEYRRDALNNVIIKKPATADRADRPPVILQGHLDMVCEKEPDYDIDFLTEGLTLREEDGYLFAEGTTLGADDGIAVAYALALLDSDDIPHPPLEVVFTTDEEVGMTGAAGIDLSDLQGSTVLNIDSEVEGVLTVGCAGGATVCCTLPIRRTTASGNLYRIEISGLTGGHSGVEIHKGRVNAAILAGQLLNRLDGELISIEGGLKDNAIPPRSAIMILSETDPNPICQALSEQTKSAEKNIQITAKLVETGTYSVLTPESLDAVKAFLCRVPNGVQRMSTDIPGLVQTSLNLGILKTEDGEISASFSVRSSVKAEKQDLIAKLTRLTEQFGGGVAVSGDYPAWEYREHSPLRTLMSEIFTEQYGYAPKIEVIHAGLECGILSEKLKNPDCVSFGPNILDIHTPAERLELASTERVWNFILEILKRI